jgi:arabinose-5-phosphate isomerase
VIPLAKIRLVLQGNTSVLTSGSANLIKNYAVQAIQGELNSLRPLETFIDDGFVKVVELLLNSNGRVVITGIGKSSIIAQKIVATMNSTGQPAIFMHAADAIHGDLGIIMPDDVVLAISKSGNTPEIKMLAPLLKRFGNKLVAMVGNMSSELAQIADFVINTTIDKEACPNNLAPTTSTTAQLLMGDALAIALLRMRNFSNEDFGRYHPGGALGKKLYLRCGELAKTNAKPFVSETASVKECIVSISAGRLGATAVLRANGDLCGIVTDGDIRRMLEKFDQLGGLCAADIMSPSPLSIQANALAAEASDILQTNKISQLIVLEAGIYQGMVHLHDLNREGII